MASTSYDIITVGGGITFHFSPLFVSSGGILQGKGRAFSKNSASWKLFDLIMGNFEAVEREFLKVK